MADQPLGEAWAPLSHVPLRAEASDPSECVNEVLAGETVTEISLGPKDWVQVRLPDGYEGWMDRRQLIPVSEMWKGRPMRLSAMSSQWKGVRGGWLPAGAVVRELEGRWYLGEIEIEPTGSLPQVHTGMGSIHVGRAVPLGRSFRLGVGLQWTHLFGRCTRGEERPKGRVSAGACGRRSCIEGGQTGRHCFFPKQRRPHHPCGHLRWH